MLAPEPGSEIDGFRLGERMHVGSMASIYRLDGARGPLPLVMKIPRLGAGERSANVVSFEQCRMVLGALSQSPHHPTLVAYGDVETIPYLVMENIEGTRLDSWIERAPLAPQDTARLGHELALALHEVHRQDVIHLDLKSTNVIYRASGDAALIDFGLSCHRAAIRGATYSRSARCFISSRRESALSARRAPWRSCAAASTATRRRHARLSPRRRRGCRR